MNETREIAGWRYQSVQPVRTWIVAIPDRREADAALERAEPRGNFSGPTPLTAEELSHYETFPGEAVCQT